MRVHQVPGALRRICGPPHEVRIHPCVHRDAPGVRLLDRLSQRVEVGAVRHGLGAWLETGVVERIRAAADLDEDRIETAPVRVLDHVSNFARAGHGGANDPESSHFLEGPHRLDEGYRPCRSRAGSSPIARARSLRARRRGGRRGPYDGASAERHCAERREQR